MEPKLPAPNLGPEQTPMPYGQNVERAPVPPNPETTIEQGGERFEQRSEAAPPATATPILPPPVTAPVPTISSEDATTPNSDDIPLVAKDDDLIEKEWVDKAKKIIIQTKDDPYMREQEVGKLQAEYLKKRYGKELGVS